MGDVADAKLTYQETGDAKEALNMLRRNRNKSLEGKLISGLAMHGPNDYVNALENVS